MSSIYDVNNLHRKFGFPVKDRPGHLDNKLMRMRLNFILEELIELGDACGFDLCAKAENPNLSFERGSRDLAPNLENALDALIDIVYVTLGTADMMGFKSTVPIDNMSNWASIWHEAWCRVHKANMAKEKGKTSRGHEIDLVKPKGWEKPQFGDLLI